MNLSLNDTRALFVGLEEPAPLLSGGSRPYVNLDNAATTPPFRSVLDHVAHCARMYSSVHRGTGYKSIAATRAFNLAREKVGRFLGIDPAYHVTIFCGYATEAINRLCCRFQGAGDCVFLTTVMEHHSNLLPWRFHGKVDYVRARRPCGMLDMEHLEEKLREHQGKVRIVAVTGASNITGLIPPLGQIARLTHQHGARLLVDASQLVAHRPISMQNGSADERIDFLVFSGHKMYAPFGSGVLIGPRDFFEEGRPGLVGGGAVDFVTPDIVEWTDLPEREEAGTPNLIGVCAISQAMDTLSALGMENVAAHERALTAFALDRIGRIPGIRIYGGCDLINVNDRLGVIPIQSDRFPHALLAAILGYEWGIGVRNGCFCAHPYVEHLLGIESEELQGHLQNVRDGDFGNLPGFVRISLGLYNTEEEVEYLATALETIQREGPSGTYRLDRRTGEYAPEGFSYDLDTVTQ